MGHEPSTPEMPLAGLSVLGVGAYPGDLEIGAGGTLARLTRAGAHVTMAVICMPPRLEARRAEASRAAALLGCGLYIVNPARVTRIEDFKCYELEDMLERLLDDHKPDVILTHVSAAPYDDCVLHQAEAAVGARQLVDHLKYHVASSRLASSRLRAQAYVDISSEIDLKLAALGAHQTRFARRRAKLDVYRDIAQGFGRAVNVGYAEGLQIVRLRVHNHWPVRPDRAMAGLHADSRASRAAA